MLRTNNDHYVHIHHYAPHKPLPIQAPNTCCGAVGSEARTRGAESKLRKPSYCGWALGLSGSPSLKLTFASLD